MPTTTAPAKATSEIDEIKEHLKDLRDDFTALAATTTKLATGQAKHQFRRAGHLVEGAADKAATYRDAVTEKVKDHPLAAIGAAVLAGIVISSLRRR
jgi:ElaB/YqjD/DUF883 family membrane-anchored ribosome-binding protein